jgi:hypothetical protein
VLEVGGVEALGEPAVDLHEQVVSLGTSALVAPEAGEAGRSAQLERFRLLAAEAVLAFRDAVQATGSYSSR